MGGLLKHATEAFEQVAKQGKAVMPKGEAEAAPQGAFLNDLKAHVTDGVQAIKAGEEAIQKSQVDGSDPTIQLAVATETIETMAKVLEELRGAFRTITQMQV